MSRNNSRKETLFSIYIKINQHKLERALKLEFRTLVMEKWCDNRRIDMIGIDMLGRKIHIEWQLDSNFKNHFIQIQDLIVSAKKYESTVIVWGAIGNREDLYIELLQTVALNSEKNIGLIFLQINDEAISILSEINQMKQLEQIGHLDRLNLVEPIFTDIKGIKNYNSSKIMKAEIEEPTNMSYTYEEKLLVSVIKRLREDFKECANIYQYKNIKSKKNFSIGSGFQDINYKISFDRRRRVSIELVFSNPINKSIFNRLFEEVEKEKIDNEFNYILKWDRNYHKIGTYFPNSSFVNPNMVKIFCRIVKLYIIGFDKHIREALEEIKENQ